MTTAQFKEKYKALQEEAKAFAAELKPLAKKYKALCKKANALGRKADNDKQLYKRVPKTNTMLGNTDETDTDGWSIHVLFRLTDFDGAEEWVQDACNVLLNLTDEPFYRKARK